MAKSKTTKELEAKVEELNARLLAEEAKTALIEEEETVVPKERKKYIKDIGIGISRHSRISEFTERRQ